MGGKYKYHTATLKQSAPFTVLYWFFPETTINFKQALPKVPVSLNYNPTPVPPEDQVARGLKLCTEIFKEFTDALLNGNKYPFKVNLMDDNLWAFPIQWLCHTKGTRPPTFIRELWHYNTGTLIPQTNDFALSGTTEPWKLSRMKIKIRMCSLFTDSVWESWRMIVFY
ncbi:hypothetical protein YA0797_21980 [Pseudomonas syringae]|nr:hypothetical protein [Pseudomonas syringae]